MNKIRTIYFILAILFGVFIFVYGEYDDSPGGQLIGLIMVIAGVLGIRKEKNRSKNSNST